jgi:hypothetical protein
MVFDKPRLPGVLAPGRLSHGVSELPEGGRACVSSGPEDVLIAPTPRDPRGAAPMRDTWT